MLTERCFVRLVLGASLWLAQAPALLAADTRPASLPTSLLEVSILGPMTVVLDDGSRLEGQLIEASSERVTTEAADGRRTEILRARIDHLRFESDTAGPLRGRLLGWMNGIYHLRWGDREIIAYDDRMLDELAGAGQPWGGPLVPVLKAFADQPAAKAGGSPVIVPAAIAPARATGIAELDIKARPNREQDQAVRFDFTLSQPLDRPVVLVYVTLDGTAVAGQDYDGSRGTLTIPAGAQGATLSIPVLDDEQVEGDQQFELFVSVDPSVARLTSRYTLGQIGDDD